MKAIITSIKKQRSLSPLGKRVLINRIMKPITAKELDQEYIKLEKEYAEKRKARTDY